MDPLTIEGFAELFQGRTDAYGTDRGGVIRRKPDEDWPTWERTVQFHLEDPYTATGVYPMRPHLDPGEHVVRWGCVDFDGHRDGDVRAHAANVQAVLRMCNAASFVERTRSGNGYHVWLFAERWENAPLMRMALLGACQVADAPLKEINPKSWSLGYGQLGNYVRLPYPQGWDTRCTQVMVTEHDVMIPLDTFVESALSSRVTEDVLNDIARLYQEPPRTFTVPDRVPGTPRGDSHSLSPLAFTIWRDGPRHGGRSEALYLLSCLMAEDGKLSWHEALDLLIDADQRWGKFMVRPNGEKTLRDMLTKAWR